MICFTLKITKPFICTYGGTVQGYTQYTNMYCHAFRTEIVLAFPLQLVLSLCSYPNHQFLFHDETKTQVAAYIQVSLVNNKFIKIWRHPKQITNYEPIIATNGRQNLPHLISCSFLDILVSYIYLVNFNVSLVYHLLLWWKL